MSWLRNRGLKWILVLIVGSMAISDRLSSGVGDVLQVTLPLAGLGCAIAGGHGIQYTGRYVAVTLAMHASKRGLGETEINARPNGGHHGMPSGHTTAAAFGASGIAQHCLSGNPPAQIAAAFAAGIVGGSRIDVGAHDLWQVMAGAILGWLGQLFGIAALDAGFRRLWFAMVRGTLGLIRAVRGA